EKARRPEGVPLQRGRPARDGGPRRLGDTLDRRRVVEPAIGVVADTVVRRAAEQLVDRDAERLALDVPERLVQPGDRRAEDRATAPEGCLVHLKPVALDPRRVLPDEIALQLADG